MLQTSHPHREYCFRGVSANAKIKKGVKDALKPTGEPLQDNTLLTFAKELEISSEACSQPQESGEFTCGQYRHWLRFWEGLGCHHSQRQCHPNSAFWLGDQHSWGDSASFPHSTV